MKFFGFRSFIILSGCVDRAFKESNLEKRSPVAATVINSAQAPAQTAKETRSAFITKTQQKIKTTHPTLQNLSETNTATSPSCKAADRIFLFNLIPAKKSHYDYVRAVRHIKPRFRLKVKSPLPNTPSTNLGGVEGGKRFYNPKGFGLRRIVFRENPRYSMEKIIRSSSPDHLHKLPWIQKDFVRLKFKIKQSRQRIKRK